ncbi:hypothetical protein VTL71DRAFT_8662 [Oculimacula yallundae]|uniref:Uncharacterized protein n=1 Tax=Oculimacula yallundae TaxID=86028 RepID=A0ABR4CY89_9HELO
MSILAWCFNSKSGRSPFESHNGLLGLLPRLRSLTLMPPPFDFQLPTSSPFLETLELNFVHDCDTRGQSMGNGHPLQILERVLWSTSLRKLVLSGQRFAADKSELFPPSRYRTSAITELELWDWSQTTLGCLPSILSCIKALQRFTLEIDMPWEVSDGKEKGVDPARLGRAVGIHASTLVTLEIAASDAAEFSGPSLFGSLSHYKNLRRLAILDELLLFVGDETTNLIDLLPPGLEEFQIQFSMLRKQDDVDRKLRISRLKQLSLAKETRFPALRRVIWWYQTCECWYDQGRDRFGPASDMEELKVAFQEVGVEFDHNVAIGLSETPFGRENGGWDEDDE